MQPTIGAFLLTRCATCAAPLRIPVETIPDVRALQQGGALCEACYQRQEQVR